MRVVYARRALAQLDEILAYIANDSPRTAAAFAGRVEAVGLLVARHPEIGRATMIEDVRVFRVGPYPYLVFYKFDRPAGVITVLRIRHTARKEDWKHGR